MTRTIQNLLLHRPEDQPFPDLEKEFEPNLLNSTVYMISMTLQLATFAINYRGHPFMESLKENKALMYSLSGTGTFIVLLALGWLPEVSEQFGIVDFPPDVSRISVLMDSIPNSQFTFQYRQMLLKVLAVDFFLSLILDRVCLLLFGEGKLRAPKC